VKIDQSFVRGLGADQWDKRIVSAVIDLAANLGLRSIAEGVETSDQLAHLRELGCDQAQGYLFARPLPPGEIPATLHPS
jgi:EAL domain-containing protein (putative c-di-GMP-specific phosphodiesterase class I)